VDGLKESSSAKRREEGMPTELDSPNLKGETQTYETPRMRLAMRGVPKGALRTHSAQQAPL